MDIYKSLQMVYNKVPSEETFRDVSLLKPCTASCFLRNINLMISDRNENRVVLLFCKNKNFFEKSIDKSLFLCYNAL